MLTDKNKNKNGFFTFLMLNKPSMNPFNMPLILSNIGNAFILLRSEKSIIKNKTKIDKIIDFIGNPVLCCGWLLANDF